MLVSRTGVIVVTFVRYRGRDLLSGDTRKLSLTPNPQNRIGPLAVHRKHRVGNRHRKIHATDQVYAKATADASFLVQESHFGAQTLGHLRSEIT